jgi:EmrB/QacA subfamily drug resistance transporter
METATRIPPQISARERWLTTALLGIGLITFAVDASNTQLSLPQIMTNMRVDLHQLHWILTAPGIARTVTIASTGWLTGLGGPRILYLICIGLMTFGSLGTMFAWDWPSLVFFRILAGMGGGMIPQISQAIFYQIFPPGQRGMALGISLMGWSIGPAFGPLMGGNLLESASWRAVYSITLPLSALGFLLAWMWLPYLGRPQRRRFDVYGALTMTVAVSTLLLALSEGNREGWDSRYILTLLAIAGVAGVLFITVELCQAQPLVELRLFGSVPFIMAMIVLFLTTMAFRGTGPMVAVLIQRLMGFGPIIAAWSQMPPNLVYGAGVLLVGRLSDRVPTYVLVITGLLMYAGAFGWFSGVNEVTTLSVFMTFLMIRFIAEAFIVSPNNLATLEALPESQVYMATGLSGLLRSIANAMGPAMAAIVWDRRYTQHLQHLAENTPLDAIGLTTALSGWQQTLRSAGEAAAQIPSQTLALLQDRLTAEAGTAAWHDYFWFNVLLACISILAALPCWRRTKYQTPPTPQPASTAPVKTATSHGVTAPSAPYRDTRVRTS